VAIFHLSARIVSRSTGRSAVAAAAYRSGARLRDERSGEEHDYTRKGGVEHAEIVAPDNAPEWMRDRAQLWNAVEKVERRRDAQLAREIEVALPRELSGEKHVEMVRGFCEAEFVSRGMIADFAIHNGRARDGGEQPHSHIMLTTRELTGEGFGPKNRDWNAGDMLDGWRSRWAAYVNAELARAGHDERVDHRSLEVQRAEAEGRAKRARDAGDVRSAEVQEARAVVLDREPEPKLGPIASQMEKLGHDSHRGDERRAVEARNAERRTLQEQARELAKEIADAARQAIEEARRRVQEVARRLEEAYQAVRDRAAAIIRPGRDASPELEPPSLPTAPDPDALLGRRKAIDPPTREIDRDALLGRKPMKEPERGPAPDRDHLLGRGPVSPGSNRSLPDRER
jgi:hypothetical protein